jgi:hypothetical protein
MLCEGAELSDDMLQNKWYTASQNKKDYEKTANVAALPAFHSVVVFFCF